MAGKYLIVVLLCCLLPSCGSLGRSSAGGVEPAAVEAPALTPPADPQPIAEAPPPVAAATLGEALRQSSEALTAALTPGTAVAVISISAGDLAEGDYALEELTMLLVNAKKFRVLDRRNLDIIREEQNFQLSGEVDDDTAVSIGRLVGAGVVISGSIAPYGQAKYLRLKALEVETARILAMSSWSYKN